MDIRALNPPAPVAPTATPPPPTTSSGPQAPSPPLGPAVTLDLNTDAAAPPSEASAATGDKAIYTRDADTKALVFQVVDPASGDVVIQIPDAVVLRARAYAASDQAGAPPGNALQRRA